MSRSRKKYPIHGFTTARSEKEDKRIINRRMRRKVRMQLSRDDREEAIFPVQDEIMDLWEMSKDGKTRAEKVDKPDCNNCHNKLNCLVDTDYKTECRIWCRWNWYQKAFRK